MVKVQSKLIRGNLHRKKQERFAAGWDGILTELHGWEKLDKASECTWGTGITM